MLIEDYSNEICDIDLNYKSYGHANQNQSPIILIHGWANSLNVVEPLAESLSKFFKIYSIDLAGHGMSGVPNHVWDMAAFAKFVDRLLIKENIAKAHFVGHSFGGKTAIKYTDLFPNKVDSLVLIGSSGFRPKPTFKKKIYFLFLKYLRNFIRFKNTKLGQKIYQDWYIPKFASRDYKNAGPMTKSFVKTLNEELYQELRGIDKRALLLWGELDDESPPSVGKKMNELIKNSNFIVLEGKDHYPFLGSGLPLITKYIRDFLQHGR